MPEIIAALALTRKASAVFEERGFGNPRLEAELLLAAALGMRRLDLYLQHDRPVAADELATFRDYVRRRLRHEPVQYITGVAHFRKLELHVDQRVLIPRPETEVLAGVAIDWARTRPGDRRLVAVDIGTGSGAIALSLVHESAFDHVVATDSSWAALEVARGNAERIGVAERVEFRHGALFEPLRPAETFDAIVSNPPYVAEAERTTLPLEVRDWEPETALFAPGDGLGILFDLVDAAPPHLRHSGLLALEVGLGQAKQVAERMNQSGNFAAVRVSPDLVGHERVVAGEVGWTNC